MHSTEHFSLSQWELEDRIRMEDFNGDNAKLDAALKKNADAIAAETAARTKAVSDEASARAKAVSDEAAARAKAVSDEINARTKAVSDETAARKSADSAETSARIAAVSALEARTTPQLIKTATISASAQTYECSLSGIDWSQWREVIIRANVTSSGMMSVYIDKSLSSYSFLSSVRPFVILLYPWYTPSLPFAGVGIASNSSTFNYPVSFSSVTTLRLETPANYPMAAGSKISIYGIK